jgi:hypothetical protein
VISFLSSAVLAIFFFMTGPNNLLNASRPNSYKEIELELTVTVALRVASLDIKQLAPKKSPVVNVFTYSNNPIEKNSKKAAALDPPRSL